MPTPSTPVRGQWFDGRTAQAHPAQVWWDAQQFWLQVEGGTPLALDRAQLRWPAALPTPVRRWALPEGASFETLDGPRVDHGAPPTGLRRWERSPGRSLLALLLMLAWLFVLWRWALPVLAEHSADWVPAGVEQRLGADVFAELDARYLQPSTLSEAERAAADAALAPVKALMRRPERVHFRAMPRAWGPNAFALPGGTVVVSDALVRLLLQADGTVHPALAGVLAHELGHVRQRHGLKSVARAAASGVVAGLWLNDASWLLASLPVWFSEAGYSRDAEREADREALLLMREAGIDPRVMVHFFAVLRTALPGRDGEGIALGLASHPADNERARFFGGNEALVGRP